jgi:hypothetical protein
VKTKPVVKFTGEVKLFPDFFGKLCARITEVKDHPVLGDEPVVYTSEVVQTETDGEYRFIRVITQNTVYEKERDESQTGYRYRDESFAHDHLASSNS